MIIYAVILPLIGSLLLFLKNEPEARFIPWIIGSLCLLASCTFIFSQYPILAEQSTIKPLFSYLNTPSLSLEISIKSDTITYILLSIICITSLFIVLFCLPYSKTKQKTDNLLAKLLITIFALMLLVIAQSPILIFIAFMLASLFSYVSSNFYQWRYRSNQASLTGLAMNIGADFMILLCVISITLYDYTHIPPVIGWLALISILIKAGQVPFGLWITETMETPSPVAAFINALIIPVSTFILFALFKPLLEACGLISYLYFIALISAVSSSLTATLQFEIKRILAYSTITVTALLIVALISGNFYLALSIIGLHAASKALLFLAYASVIQASSGEHDIRTIGGLGKVLKFSCLNATIGSFGIILICDTYMISEASLPYLVAGIVTAILTTFNLFRPMLYIFFGNLYGEDAIIARITKEKTEIILNVIGLTAIAIVAIIIFASSPVTDISSVFVISTLATIIIATFGFIYAVSLRAILETKCPKLYFFVRGGFGASTFYQKTLPSFAKIEGELLSGEINKIIGIIGGATYKATSSIPAKELTPTAYNPKKHLAIVFIGIFLLLLFSFFIKDI